MNILDTFILLFKSDTTDLKKGGQEAQKTQKDLQENIKKTNADTLDLGISFIDLATKAAAALGVVVGVGAAVKSAFGSVSYIEDLNRVSDTIGVNVEELEIWDRAFKRIAGSSASAVPAISQLNKELHSLTNVAAGALVENPITPFLKNLNVNGVTVYKDAFKTLLSEAKKIDEFKSTLRSNNPNLSEDDIQAYANSFSQNQLGNDAQTTLLISQGYEKLADQLERIKKRGVPSAEDNAQIKEFYQNWSDVTQTVVNLGIKITGPFIAALNAILNPTEETAQAFKDLGQAILVVGGAFAVIETILATLGVPLLIGPIVALTTAFFGLAAAVLAATWPLLLVVAAVAAVWAIIHYGPQILDALGRAFGAVFGKMKEWASDVVDIFKDLFGWVGKVINAAQNFSWKKPGKPTAEGQAQIDEYNQQESVYRAAMALRHASSAPISAQTNSSVINSPRLNSNSVKIDTINVQTQATDANGIASSIDQGIKSHFSQTIMQFADGILG